jgi:hypothetical protein
MALVQYTGKNVFGVFMGAGDIMRLLPGVNEINDEHLKKAMELPLFNDRIKKGQVLILNSPVGKDGKRTVEDMLTNIPNMFDVKLLKKIIETDGRDAVVKAATTQIEKIKNPSKAKADESEHFK